MFGESDSESPRIPSPWDSLTPPPSPNGIPKLVPEADEGNVEYKLQLLSPTPARFARLVTQLKWRLLEGGGQAYYELGVADSGMLVGLPRPQLEDSLDTLEMMAGEIGASVIVVKEIEVPPELSNLAESQLERWDASRRNTRRKDLLRMAKLDDACQLDASPTTSATELETELSSTDVTDIEATTPLTSFEGEEPNFSPPKPSPNLFPFDPSLAMFTMDAGEQVVDCPGNETPDSDVPNDHPAEFSLEISTVYKPRPMKKRAMHVTPSLSHSKHAKKKHRNGYPPSQSTDTIFHTGGPITQDTDETLSHIPGQGARVQPHQDERDQRSQLKLSPLLTPPPTGHSSEPPVSSVNHQTLPSRSVDDHIVSALESLQVAVVGSPVDDTSEVITTVSKEPRLIVEALVVRKLSLDEAFLDFEGFSLQ